MRILLALLFFLSSESYAADPQIGASGSPMSGPSFVFSWQRSKVVHVEYTGTMHNDNKEVEHGSGIRVSRKYIITNSHVILDTENYRSYEIGIRFARIDAAPISARLVLRDDSLDLALLEIDASLAPKMDGCPLLAIHSPDFAPAGAALYVMGFPIGKSLRITAGVMSLDPAASSPWETDAALNPGSSGGPAFTERGLLAGIVKGRASEWQTEAGATAIQGVGYIIPAPAVLDSEVGKIVLREKGLQRCLASTQHQSIGSGMEAALASIDEAPHEMEIAQSISGEIDPDRGSRRGRFVADVGYSITSCEFEPAAEVSEPAIGPGEFGCVIGDGGQVAAWSFSPTQARTLTGSVVMRQVKKGDL